MMFAAASLVYIFEYILYGISQVFLIGEHFAQTLGKKPICMRLPTQMACRVFAPQPYRNFWGKMWAAKKNAKEATGFI